MPFIQPNDESKQHINLSPSAFAIIENDMHSFKMSTKSGFFNQVIKNFREDANASISLSKQREREKYELTLSAISNESIRSQAIDLLEEEFVKNITKQNQEYEKGITLKFRINKDNLEYLTTECDENIYYSNIGKYLKALLEEYCNKSYLERERIFFLETFSCIELAIKEQKQLKIKLPDSTETHIKPFAIKTDPLSMYHYLIGYSVDKTNSISPKQSFSYRITNLEHVKILKKNAFLSKEDKKKLSDELKEKGAQFMCEDICETKVALTEEGIKKYHRLLHLRPPYTSIEKTANNSIYTFHCTNRQIEFYFFKFGDDAEILTPTKTREHFHNMYERALKKYGSL